MQYSVFNLEQKVAQVIWNYSSKVCWQKLKKQSERRRLGIVLSMEDFSKFRGEVEEFDQWLYSMEQTHHNHVIGDVVKVG